MAAISTKSTDITVISTTEGTTDSPTRNTIPPKLTIAGLIVTLLLGLFIGHRRYKR